MPSETEAHLHIDHLCEAHSERAALRGRGRVGARRAQRDERWRSGGAVFEEARRAEVGGLWEGCRVKVREERLGRDDRAAAMRTRGEGEGRRERDRGPRREA